MPVNPHEKALQRALIQYRNPKNYDLVEEALTIAGRTDLIGYEKNCLIRPRKNAQQGRKPGGSDAVRKDLGRNSAMRNSSGKNASASRSSTGKTSGKIAPADKSPKNKSTGSRVQKDDYQGVKTQGVKNQNKKTIRNVHKKKF